MNIQLDKSRDARYFYDKWDLSNLVAFCCGAKQKLIEYEGRKAELLTPSSLTANEELCYLRALCACRNSFLSNFQRFQIYARRKIKLYDALPFPPYARPVMEHQGNMMFDREDLTLLEHFAAINSAIREQARVILKFLPAEEQNPSWVLELFDFPEMTDDQILQLACYYSRSWSSYPMRCWVNTDRITPDLFRNDYTMMFEIYRMHGKCLEYWQPYKGGPRVMRLPKVNYEKLAVSNDMLEYLKGILSNDDRKIAIVDTQNLSPFWTYKFFDWIQEEFPDSITKVVMFVDGKEHWQWGKAEAAIPFPIERVDSPRVLKGKSTVDTALTIHLMKLYYELQCSNFLVFSGDCDFMPLITALPDATFCFCGLSGGTSRRTIDFANTNNAKFIIMDDFLRSINYGMSTSVSMLDDVVDRLNAKDLNVSLLITSTTEACSFVGKKVDTAVACTLLNEILSTFTVKVTEDGFLHFENKQQIQQKQRGAKKYGTNESCWQATSSAHG